MKQRERISLSKNQKKGQECTQISATERHPLISGVSNLPVATIANTFFHALAGLTMVRT